MATNPKLPAEPERRPGPQQVQSPVPVYPSSPPRSFRYFMVGVALLGVAVVIFIAVWLLTFGGGNQQQQRPKPGGSGNGLPSTMSAPVLPRTQPPRAPLYAWAK